ncbi:hypothetical protein [Clostridium disporicum]
MNLIKPYIIKLNIPSLLAVDEIYSNDGSNLLDELRVYYLLYRL